MFVNFGTPPDCFLAQQQLKEIRVSILTILCNNSEMYVQQLWKIRLELNSQRTERSDKTKKSTPA